MVGCSRVFVDVLLARENHDAVHQQVGGFADSGVGDDGAADHDVDAAEVRASPADTSVAARDRLIAAASSTWDLPNTGGECSS